MPERAELLPGTERCDHTDCGRVRAPGAEFCCGACQLATAVGYPVPDTPSLGHTQLCELRQQVTPCVSDDHRR